jgi:tRNA (guanine37-N1)-methyltransferase
MIKIQVVTLFPEMFEGVLNSSMMWKAQDKKAVDFRLINLRDFGLGLRKRVDDTPYGGGDGMLLMIEPLAAAIADASAQACASISSNPLRLITASRFNLISLA